MGSAMPKTTELTHGAPDNDLQRSVSRVPWAVMSTPLRCALLSLTRSHSGPELKEVEP